MFFFFFSLLLLPLTVVKKIVLITTNPTAQKDENKWKKKKVENKTKSKDVFVIFNCKNDDKREKIQANKHISEVKILQIKTVQYDCYNRNG